MNFDFLDVLEALPKLTNLRYSPNLKVGDTSLEAAVSATCVGFPAAETGLKVKLKDSAVWQTLEVFSAARLKTWMRRSVSMVMMASMADSLMPDRRA